MLNKIITDKEFNLDIKEMTNPKIRIGARGIVIDSKNNIAVFNKKNKNEYKLPGGGVDAGEIPEDAFIREVKEETGLIVEITSKLGTIEERKSHSNFIQLSHVFVSKVIADTKIVSLTQKEKDEGGQLVWLNFDEALTKISECIDLIKESKYENLYHSKFIVTRDKFILDYYIKGVKL